MLGTQVVSDIFFFSCTTTRYLNELIETGLVQKVKHGRSHHYINVGMSNHPSFAVAGRAVFA